MASIDFDELKQKAKDTVGVIADASVELYKLAEEKTRVFAKTAKLQAENAGDRNSVRRLYAEIGKLYYARFKDAPDPELTQLCAEIAAAQERVAARLEEIERVKAAAGVDGAEDAETESAEAEEEVEEEASDE
ncbi:MAG: hypothetical protein LBT12_00445 [Oscillospiraceae bacterium]|jgi:FAD/FMN-containing dehydrogenase|nr:hypothetical protein [Oscillospiraceae bacterium]